MSANDPLSDEAFWEWNKSYDADFPTSFEAWQECRRRAEAEIDKWAGRASELIQGEIALNSELQTFEQENKRLSKELSSLRRNFDANEIIDEANKYCMEGLESENKRLRELLWGWIEHDSYSPSGKMGLMRRTRTALEGKE